MSPIGPATVPSSYSGEFKPHFHVFDSRETLGQACANCIIEEIQKNKQVVLGLATGSTPLPVYKALVKAFNRGGLDLSEVTTFNLDEYVGLDPRDKQSYHYYMKEKLFKNLMWSEDNPLGIKTENIHIPNGQATKFQHLSFEEQNALKKQFPLRGDESTLSSLESNWIICRRAEAYDRLINQCGPIDIQILGIGENGHLAFCEPGSSHEGRTSLVELTANTRAVNGRFFHDRNVPTQAISMGIGTILQARKIYLLATGERKQEILKKTLYGKVCEEIPATALKKHSEVIFFLDIEANPDKRKL